MRLLLLALLSLLPLPPATAATLIVDNTSDDPARQACTAAANDCSLRGALIKTQRDLPGEDTVAFDIPMSDPGCVAATGVCTITLSTDSLVFGFLAPGDQSGPGQGITIDGYTQPGASVNTLPLGQGTNAQLKIKLRSPANNARQLVTRNPFTIRGLIFENMRIEFERGDGGSGGSAHPSTQRYEFYGNFVGYDADGVTPLSASFGVGNYIRTSNQVRGVRIGSGNPADINLFGAGAQKPNFCLNILGENRVQGNFIGTDRSGITGSGCLNGLQVSHQASPNFGPLDIGGAAPGQGNVIARHVNTAIDIIPGERNVLVRIRGNHIGIGVDGVTPAPNLNLANSVCTAFAAIRGGSSLPGSAQIGGLLPGEGNLFGPNGIHRPRCPLPGVQPPPYAQTVAAGEGLGVWAVQGNRYVGLQGMAVDLVPSNVPADPQRLPNDADDADPLGANRRQNFPVISAFATAGDQVNLTYRVDSTTANSLYPLSIEFLKDDGRGNLTPIGTDVYTAAEAQTDKAISFTLPAGVTLGANDVVVATATTTPVANPGPGDNASGESSETSFYPLESFTLVSVPPSVQAGVPFPVCVRAVAAPGSVFKPIGPVLIQARVGPGLLEECVAQLVPSSVALTSTAGCNLVTSSPPGTLGVRVSFNAALAPFALPNGGSPTSVVQPITVAAGASTLEIVDGNHQTADLFFPFGQPLRVRVLGSGGLPVAGAGVAFQVPESGAAALLSQSFALTDGAGIATVQATAAGAPGTYAVSARVGALLASFTLTNLPGPSLFRNDFESPEAEPAVACPPN